MLALFCVRADVSDARLNTIVLPSDWAQVPAIKPNIYMAIQPGTEIGKRDESYLSVQSHSLSGSDVMNLKRRLLGGGVKSGDRFGEWTVETIAQDGSCFALKLSPKVSSERKIDQQWCFTSGQALVITESGPKRIGKTTRMKFSELLSKGDGR